MPTFATPEPISVSLELGVGDIQIVAGEWTDTVVEVSPSDRAKRSDVTAAAEARVDYAGGKLSIKASSKGWRQWSPRGGGESIDVRIELPAGSEVRGEAGVAALRATGRVGDCRFKTGVGEIRIEAADAAVLTTGYGDITVEDASSSAVLITRSGGVRVGRVGGAAVIKNANGDTWVGEVTGALRVNAANGNIVVDRAQATVAAKTANGDVHIGEVAHGAVVAQTARGKVEVGVREGVAAWLDLDTHFGTVVSALDAADGPGAGEDVVEVRARSAFGDITVRRSVGGAVPRS